MSSSTIRISISTMAEESAVPLQTFINKAQTKSILPGLLQPGFSAAFDKCATAPVLHKSRKNRIIYYIGSFNPPHLGHLALIDHISRNALATSRDSDSSSDDSLQAAALIIVLHGETWIERKLRKEQFQLRNKPKSKHNHNPPPPPLHLDFKQRSRLVREGLPDEILGRGVWLFPDTQPEWSSFSFQLVDACKREGYPLEMIELLGPDYVSWARPQCSGWHGIVTSNICRPTDFEIADEPSGLKNLDRFGDWVEVAKESFGVGDHGELSTSSVDERDVKAPRDGVWVCKHLSHPNYRVWFVRRDGVTLTEDISSTQLRSIIYNNQEITDLEQAVGKIAMSPRLLVQYVRTQKRKG